MADVLNKKHRLFVEAYDGDLVFAMQAAGYQGQPAVLEKQGQTLLQNPKILEAIQERSKYLAKTKDLVASREERQMFWTALMRNKDPHRTIEVDEFGVPKQPEPIPISMRIKAAELLGKSEADFTEKHQIEGNITVTDIISQSYTIDDDDLDAIEAEYEELRQKTLPKETHQEESTSTETEDQSGDESSSVVSSGTGSDDNSSDDSSGAGSFI